LHRLPEIAVLPAIEAVWSSGTAHAPYNSSIGGATEQKTRLRIQATSTIESDGLRSGRNRRMATIRDRLVPHDRNSKVGVDQILAFEG
jgi:hypothetical protein